MIKKIKTRMNRILCNYINLGLQEYILYILCYRYVKNLRKKCLIGILFFFNKAQLFI